MEEILKSKLSLIKIVFTLIYLLFFPGLLLFLSGDWFWMEGWIFSSWFIVMCFSTILYLYRHDPELLNERYKKTGRCQPKRMGQVCRCWNRHWIYCLDNYYAFGCKKIRMVKIIPNLVKSSWRNRITSVILFLFPVIY